LTAAQNNQTLMNKKNFVFVGNRRRFAALLSESVANEGRVARRRSALEWIVQSK
jgi:hypothetical protein